MALSDEITEAMRDLGLAIKAIARAEAQIEMWKAEKQSLEDRIIEMTNSLSGMDQRRQRAAAALTALLTRQWLEEEGL